jgi:hypothetical protein
MPRLKFQPTDEQRRMVKSLAGCGLKQEHIAPLLGLASTTTLRKYFREELERGPVEAHANVRRTLFKLATSGRNPGATMYWLKTRARWSEKGKTPEPVDTRPGEARWRVTVYQPPRAPEHDQQLQEATSRRGGSDGRSAEWEEADDSSPPSG